MKESGNPHIFLRQITSTIGLVGLSLFSSCSSIKPEPIDPTADVQSELLQTDRALSAARSQQVDVLSPKNFTRAQEEFDSAKRARDNGRDSDKVFADLGRARAHLKVAVEAAGVTKAGLSRTVEARAGALANGAQDVKRQNLKRIDDDLIDVTEDAEAGNLDRIKQYDDKLAGRYSRLEIDAVQEKNLAGAREKIEQAKKEDAKEWAGRTLDEVQAKYDQLYAAIESNRNDPSIGEKASNLNAAADRLLTVTRQAKQFEKKDAESLVLETERLKQQTAQQQQQIAATSAALETSQERTQQYEQQSAFEQKFNEARAMFAPEEAEVFRQGDVLTMRLKKLNFQTGRASIQNDSYPVLTKVETVIRKFDSPRVMIEGHTDSTGSKAMNLKLSRERAEAVANYLVAQGIPSANISTAGYGDEKPLASNKTKEGRASNRRVDIVVDSRREAVSL